MYLSQFLEVSAGRLHESIRLDEDILIHGFSPLSETRGETISWSRSEDINWSEIKASVIICPIATPTPPSSSFVLVRTESPRKLFAEWLNLFVTSLAPILSGIEKTAVVHSTAKIHGTAYVGHFAVIEEDVVIGARSSVGHHSVVGSKTVIGDDVILKPHCVVEKMGLVSREMTIIYQFVFHILGGSRSKTTPRLAHLQLYVEEHWALRA